MLMTYRKDRKLLYSFHHHTFSLTPPITYTSFYAITISYSNQLSKGHVLESLVKT